MALVRILTVRIPVALHEQVAELITVGRSCYGRDLDGRDAYIVACVAACVAAGVEPADFHDGRVDVRVATPAEKELAALSRGTTASRTGRPKIRPKPRRSRRHLMDHPPT